MNEEDLRQMALTHIAANEQGDALDEASALKLATAVRDQCTAEFNAQLDGALLYITAMVVKAGGIVEFEDSELRAVGDYILERADPESGGLILRAYKPLEHAPIEPPPDRHIIVP